MAYQSPFLSRLDEDEERRRYEQNRSDTMRREENTRVKNAVDLMNEAPITLHKMLGEDADRRQRIKEYDKRAADSDRNFARDVFVTDRERDDKQKVLKKVSDEKRGRELAENAVKSRMFVPEGQKQRVQIPVEQDVFMPAAAPPPMTGESADFHRSISGGMGGVDPFLPPQALIKTRQPVQNAVPLTPGHAHIAETGLPEKENLLEQSMLGDMQMARSIYEQDRAIYDAANMKIEDIAANIANQRMAADTRAHKQGVDHDKLALDRQKLEMTAALNQAKIAKLNRPPQLKAKTEKEWPVSWTKDERADARRYMMTIRDVDQINALVDKDPSKFGTLFGFANKLKTTLKMRGPEEAQAFVRMAAQRDSMIKALAGATVTDQEMNRIIQQLPTEYDDAKTLKIFLSSLRDEAETNFNNMVDLADFGKRAPTAMAERKRTEAMPTNPNAPVSPDQQAKDIETIRAAIKAARGR